jgi:oxygen-independent coproporphyrinogen-3 oxidase
MTSSLPFWREYPERDTEWVRQYPTRYRALTEDEVWQRDKIAFYLHIPFCNNLCTSCPYVKYRTSSGFLQRYIDGLKSEISNYANRPYVQNRDFEVGYIGGGTPTALSATDLDNLLQHMHQRFSMSDMTEFTMETTPIDIDDEKATALKNNGVNRISIGVQTFEDDELRSLGRDYGPEKIIETIEMLRKVGFDWINIDLMYGLPGQTHESFERSLDCAKKNEIPNISFYSYISFASLAKKRRNKIPDCPDSKTRNMMFLQAAESLTSGGYSGYYGDAFALPDTIPQYGVVPWSDGIPLVPLGSSATGRMRSYWYFNEPDSDTYLDMIEKGDLPIAMGQYISKEEELRRAMVLGVKTCRVERAHYKNLYGIDFADYFAEIIAGLEEKELVRLTDEALEVREPKGWLYLDNISKAFYSEKYRRHPQPIGSNISKWLSKDNVS